MSNNSFYEVKGIGNIRFMNPDGITFVLYDVRYIPSMSKNMISMGTLESKICKFRGDDCVLKVVKGCTMFMKGIWRASLYVLQA